MGIAVHMGSKLLPIRLPIPDKTKKFSELLRDLAASKWESKKMRINTAYKRQYHIFTVLKVRGEAENSEGSIINFTLITMKDTGKIRVEKRYGTDEQKKTMFYTLLHLQKQSKVEEDFNRCFLWGTTACAPATDNVIRTKITPQTWRKAHITLIPKEQTDTMLIKNYRPISLLNEDYKLFAKILATRFKKFLLQFVEKDQTGFLPKR